MEHFERSATNRGGVGASCSVFFLFLHPAKLVSYRYLNKDKCHAIDGVIINRIDVIRLTIREQLYIFMKHEDLGDHELHSVFLLVWPLRFQSLLIMGWYCSIPEHRL